MKEEVIRKYVKELDGLIKEIRHWEEERPLWESDIEEYMYENAVVFAFGGLYRFFNFEGIHFGMPRGLDCGVVWKGEHKLVEFEVSSRNFQEHIKKGDVKPSDYKDIIIVCWKHKPGDCPEEIDVIELRHFWKLAKEQKST